jgi:methyl-accepting chemotaxis protein
MKNITIIGKFLIIMGVFGVFTLAVAAYVGSQMWKIDSSYSALGAGPTHAAFAMQRANRAFTLVRSAVADQMMASTEEENRAAVSGLEKARKTFTDELDAAAKDAPAIATDIEALKARGAAISIKPARPPSRRAQPPVPPRSTSHLKTSTKRSAPRPSPLCSTTLKPRPRRSPPMRISRTTP